jgi:hypothetical protein
MTKQRFYKGLAFTMQAAPMAVFLGVCAGGIASEFGGFLPFLQIGGILAGIVLLLGGWYTLANYFETKGRGF